MIKTLDILVGLPGSGKTTLANSLNGKIIEVDNYRIKNGLYIFDLNDEYDVLTQSFFDAKPEEITFNRVIYDESFWTNTHKKRRIVIDALVFLYKFEKINIHVFPFDPKNSVLKRLNTKKGTNETNWIKVIGELSGEYEEPIARKNPDCNIIRVENRIIDT